MRAIPTPHPHIGTARAIKQEVGLDPFTEAPYQWGYVHAVHTSPHTVDLYLDGTQTLGDTTYLTKGVRYMSDYSPTVGDVVVVLRNIVGSTTDRVVLGTLA